jgi:uncharacterized repeat protein (TIGR01451 family)
MAAFRIRPGLRKIDQNPQSSRSLKRQVWRALASTAKNQQLLLEQEVLRHHGSETTDAAEFRDRHGEVKQGKEAVPHSRVSVRLTQCTEQRCRIRGVAREFSFRDEQAVYLPSLFSRWRLVLAAITALTAAMLSVPGIWAQAAMAWRPGGANGGTGTWDLVTANWNNGAQTTWSQGFVAGFVGTAGTVTVGAPIEVSRMDLGSDGYVFSGGTLTLVSQPGITTPLIITNPGVTATINSSLAGTLGWIKTGAGTLVLTGNNSFLGGLAINAGTLQVSNNNNLGGAAQPLSFDGGTLATSVDISTARLTTLNAGGGTFDVANGSMLTMSGVIGGTGALTKANTGSLALTGANTFTGAANIAAGTVVLGNNSSLGSTAAGTTVAAAASLDLNGKSVGAEQVTLNGGTIANSFGADGFVASLVTSANGFLMPGAGWIEIGSTSGAGSLTISSTLGRGVFNNTIGGNWVHAGGTILSTGALDIYGGTSITGGPITINGGSLHRFGAGSRIGDNVAVTVNGGALELREADETIGSLAGIGGTVNLNALTLTTGGTNASTTYSGVISGAGGSLVKTGSGTLTLSGNNTYTGGTTISSGTLLVTGTLTSPVAVANGATLAGTGTIAANVAIGSGATLAPGASPGVITVAGDLTLTTGSTLAFELGAPNVVGGPLNDRLQVNGTLTIAGTTLNVTDIGAFASTPGVYRLIDYTGTLVGSANNLTLGTLPGVPPHTAIVQTSIAGQVNLIIGVEADVALTLTGPPTAVAGVPLVYTISVTNNGPADAEQVVVTDPTPAGLQFVSNTGDCITAFPCNLGTLPAGATRTITTTFTMPSAAGVALPLVNIATVSTTTPDAATTNNTAQFESTVMFDADVEVSAAVAPATGVLVGDTIVITVSALNRGPNPATGVAVTDVLPAGFTLVSATPSQGTYDSVTGVWTIGSLPATATAQLALTIDVTTPGAIINLAVKTGQNEPDLVTANDTAAATINVAAAADLTVGKTRDVSEPLVGAAVTFTVRVANRGPSPATGVTIDDLLPAGLTFVSATPSQGAYDAAIGVWTIGGLAVLGEATLTVTATVAAAGALTNNAAVAAHDQVDPNPLNDRAAASINAVPNADLQVAKAVSNLAPAVGSDVTYTIAVTNLGPSAATSAEILDALPPGVTFVSATTSQGTYDPMTGVWTLGAIPVTGTATLSSVGHVTQLAAIENTATRQSSAPIDPNDANDGAMVTSTPTIVADLQVVKTPSAASVVAGTPLTWTIVVTNHGPSAVTAAPVSDPFLATFTSPQWTCSASVGAACSVPSGTGALSAAVTLPANGTATFVVSGIVANAVTGTLDSVVTVAPPTDATDPNLTNNTATAPVLITASADLAVTGTGPATTTPGTTVSYTITMRNNGPSLATAVGFNAATPAGVTLDSVAGACIALPCALGDIPPSQARLVTLTYAVPLTYPAPTPIVVTASANSAADPNAANNTASVTTTVAPLSDVSIAKAGPTHVVPGKTATYTLTVTNAGSTAADDVVLTDPTPSGLTFVSASAPCASGFPCAFGSLGPGASITVTAIFTLSRTPTTGTIVNTATVASTTAETSTTNNTATAVARIVRTGCDVNGDGVDEIVTGAGPGGGPHVQVLDVAHGGPATVASFYAYHPAFGGGVFVACGDVDGDGRADVVTGAGPGGGPHVRAFSFPATGGIVEIAGFFAYDPVFGGGVRVAAADVDGDGAADIITAAGRFGGPHVRVFRIAGGTPIEIASFYAYDPAFAGGVYVAGGDVTRDGRAEIITGTTHDGGPVRVFSLDAAGISERLHFFPYIPGFYGEVRVAAGDVNGDGVDEIITAAGPGGGPHVVVWSLGAAVRTPLASFYAYDPRYCDVGTIFPDPQVCDGVFVAAGDVDGDSKAEVITGTNRQGGPVRVFQIGPGVFERFSFYPYFEAFRGPVHVAAGMHHRDLPIVSSDGGGRSLLSLDRHDWPFVSGGISQRLDVRFTTLDARGRSPPGRGA